MGWMNSDRQARGLRVMLAPDETHILAQIDRRQMGASATIVDEPIEAVPGTMRYSPSGDDVAKLPRTGGDNTRKLFVVPSCSHPQRCRR